MTINAKTLIKDKFWIVESKGHKLGTLQKEDTNGWIFLGKNQGKEVFHTKDSLYKKFGEKLFSSDITIPSDVESENTDTNWEVHGFPVNQKPFNPIFDVQKKLPIYTKAKKSKSQFCAGYYIIDFPKGWRKAYCPKLITLQRYDFKGPIKTKIEMQQILNNAIKENISANI